MTVVRDQHFPQKPPVSRFRSSRTGVQPSLGSSTIELPSAFAELGAYPPHRALPGSPRQCSLTLACRHPPEDHQIGAREMRTPEKTILSQPYCRRVSTDRPKREGSQLAAVYEGGCRFMAAWVKEEENASKHLQKKREAEKSDKVGVAPGVTVASLRRFRAALIGPSQGLPKRRRPYR